MSYDVDLLERAVYDTAHGFVNAATGRRGVVGLADVIGVRATTLQNKVNPREEFSHVTLNEARSMMLATGDHSILHRLADDVGEACVPLPSFEFAADADLLDAWADWQADIGETAATAKAALADKRVTLAEVEAIRRELIEDFEKGLAMLDVFKGMAELDDTVVSIKR